MPRLYKKDDNCNYQYTNWLNLMSHMVAPKNMIAVLGRGTGKTTDILSERLLDCMYDMPRAYFAFASDTYTHALADMVPTLLDGLERKGLREGVDYVVDKRPPEWFTQPYKRPVSYKHTISFRNGVFVKIVSMDEPSSLAGASYQHVLGDEAKYLDFEVLRKLFPAIRGEYLSFSHSPFYRGMSFTTDMPVIGHKSEYDWFMDMEEQMNRDQIQMIFATGKALNDYKIKYVRAYAKQKTNEMRKYQKQIDRWEERWTKLRKNSTLFVVSSSLVNSDLLRTDYFVDSLNSLKWENFKSSVLSLKPELEAGEKFYVNLSAKHLYQDGVNNEFYKNHNLQERLVPSSESLRYIKSNQALEAGVDFGNMCSMVTGQQQGNEVYALKEFYTLAPESVIQLGEKFREFYRNHRMKKLDMYYDRSGNQYQQIQRDFASDLKNAIEFDIYGKRTGWTVNLMSLNQKNILQSEEYNFMRVLLGESNVALPKVQIDKRMCKCLLSSLELSKVVIRKNSSGRTVFQKDKTSERLPLHKLPEYSTNFSDAFKYWLSRKEWLRIAGRKRSVSIDSPTIY